MTSRLHSCVELRCVCVCVCVCVYCVCVVAEQPKKRVLIQFGCDWNTSCKKFHWLLTEVILVNNW